MYVISAVLNIVISHTLSEKNKKTVQITVA